MEVGARLPGFSLRDNVGLDGRYYTSGVERADTLYLEFVSAHDYRRGEGSAAVAYTLDEGVSYIQFNVGSVSYSRDDETTTLLAHELMHALPDFSHVSPEFATILEGTGAIHDHQQNGQRQPLSLLYPVDREALRAFYGRSYGSSGFTTLGPWESTSLHLTGRTFYAAFGVALRNDYAEPWAYGLRPSTDLAANSRLQGSASWRGILVGMTPAAEAVAGDAAIDVTLATMQGRAAFTDLESWASGRRPGDAGTGAEWLDGDLAYSISVRGNTFRQTAGDAGRLTGVFVGRDHEGATGTLERTDLTAAFGATR